MNKSQTFGIDILIIVLSAVVFSELIYLFYPQPNDLARKKVENQQLIYTWLRYNNTLYFINCYFCYSDSRALEEINRSIEAFVANYSKPRDYLLLINGMNYSSEGIGKVCLKRASPIEETLHLACGKIISIQFSIYYRGDRVKC